MDGAFEVEDDKVSFSSECCAATKRLERLSRDIYISDSGILRSEYKSACSPVECGYSIYLEVVDC